jgi:hypothetical protein
MPTEPRTARPSRRRFLAGLSACGSLMALGCGGDNPSRMAGTIELPPREPSGPFRPNAAARGKAQAKP